jgi:hypothetical protein
MDAGQILRSLDVVEARQNDVIAMETGIRNMHDMLVYMSTVLDQQVRDLANRQTYCAVCQQYTFCIQ